MIKLLNIDCMEFMAGCKDNEFDLTGCEIDKDYYEAACKRLKQHQSQMTLF